MRIKVGILKAIALFVTRRSLFFDSQPRAIALGLLRGPQYPETITLSPMHCNSFFPGNSRGIPLISMPQPGCWLEMPGSCTPNWG
ncbi:hypothetical protein NG799_22990 [Laspinema sp. D1]|uniref:Uncharacterized protein n=1 Tax=Laspinema palackyanum D2a TaxID=2953684 RepID=A0ABT2N0C5_9CYAN|nr:hypothetical protein [Laspinema sp. D2a]